MGVSPIQAMKAFTIDDNKLLKTSRFPVLKNELLSFLTSAQSIDVAEYERSFFYLKANLPKWKQLQENGDN